MTTHDVLDRQNLERPRRSLRKQWPVLVTIGLLLVLPLLVDNLNLRRYGSLIVLSLGVLGVVVATGYTGLISLGHGVFVGLGACTMGAMLDWWNLPFVVAVLGAFLVTAAVGWVLGLPALRVHGIYLALLTLGLALLFPSLIKKFPSFSGGVSGKAIDKTLEPPGWLELGEEHTITWRYYFCLLVCLVMFWLTRNLVTGRMGRAMQAVRDSEPAAASFGVNLPLVKAGAFGYSAGLAGVAGALQVVLFPFVSHDQYTVFLSFRLYAAAVMGGVAAISGAVWGVVALVLVPAVNDALQLLENDVFVFGVGLIALTFVSPDGIAGLAQRLRASGGFGKLWTSIRTRYAG